MEITIVVVRALLSAGFIYAGIYALRIGFRLYMRGVGLMEEASTVSVSGGGVSVKSSLKKVGSVVMATSIAWGALAYFSLPGVASRSSDGTYFQTKSRPDPRPPIIR